MGTGGIGLIVVFIGENDDVVPGTNTSPKGLCKLEFRDGDPHVVEEGKTKFPASNAVIAADREEEPIKQKLNLNFFNRINYNKNKKKLH